MQISSLRRTLHCITLHYITLRYTGVFTSDEMDRIGWDRSRSAVGID